MASWGKTEFEQLKQFQKQLQEIQENQLQTFLESCTKELASRLLAKVVKRTPVGDYSGDAYTTKKGKTGYRKYKTVKFTTKGGQAVTFRAKVSKRGGTLRRGWTSKTQEEAESRTDAGTAKPEYTEGMKVENSGGNYTITVINPVKYAPYVEFGHRTRNHKGWVKGQFMLTISEKEIREAAPAILERRLQKWLNEVFR